MADAVNLAPIRWLSGPSLKVELYSFSTAGGVTTQTVNSGMSRPIMVLPVGGGMTALPSISANVISLSGLTAATDYQVVVIGM